MKLDKTRIGRCYQLAGTYALDNPGVTLVHGSIEGYGKPRLGHAWVELPSGNAWEPITDQIWPADVFASFFNPIVDARFDGVEMRTKMLATGHWGPWVSSSGVTREKKVRRNFYVRPKTYRGVDGFRVGSRGKPWNVSIFVRTREGAEAIRDAYKISDAAGEAMTTKVFDAEASGLRVGSD